MADDEKIPNKSGEIAQEGAPEDKKEAAADEISWDDVMEDMEKQKEMINQEATGGATKAETVQEDNTSTQTAAAIASQETSGNIDFILDIPLTVTVELGRTRMLINDLLQIGQGSVIELTKLVGEPLEVMVNDKLVARGEVVVVNEKFGVRLTDIISPLERIEKLK